MIFLLHSKQGHPFTIKWLS